MKRLLILALAALALSSCVEPELPEGDSNCTLTALKITVYDADLNVVAKDLNALGGMYDAEGGAGQFKFPKDISDISRCRLEASIPATATIEETDAYWNPLGHGIGGIRDLDKVTVYFTIKAANGKDCKNYQIYFKK
ncbi:MAG: hypothetical protein IKS71_02690 [Bacteroidales bacterium]|nr:hypothetical protein [Bacteroidales bacterium]